MQKHFGDSLSPAIKYWVFLTGIIAIIFTVIFGSLEAAYLNLLPEEQAVVERLFDKLLPFPFVGSLILVAFICTLVSLLFRYYIIPVLRMAEQTRLITAANPDYRINGEGAHELLMLAKVINESADASQRLQSQVDQMIQQANLALKDERNRFAALISELPCGVVVCNRDGRILLYNRLAQDLLRPAREEQEGHGAIGLGRSIFGVLERDPLVHALEVMNHDFGRDQIKPALGLMTKLCGSRFIRVNMAPVTGDEDAGAGISGFVLSLEDISHVVDADNERDRLLQGIVDSVQSSISQLSKKINTICHQPKVREEDGFRNRKAVGQIINELEKQLALARGLYSGHHRVAGKRDNVLAETLLKLLKKNLFDRFAMQTEAKVTQNIWLKVDSFAIVQTLTNLAGLLNGGHNIASLTLQVDSAENASARLEMSWADQMVPLQSLLDWQKTPLLAGGDGATLSPLAIITEHGGQMAIWETGNSFCSGISITLPVALEDELADLHSSVAPRPVSYEFDLFHQPGQKIFGKVPLRNLTYVAFDTETTGLNPSEGDEIVQLGAVRIVNSRLLHNECVDQLVNPQRPVPESSVRIHGIAPELLPAQPIISKVLPLFHSFTADSVLVAHNAAFDMRFLQLKEEEAGVHFDNPVLDTLLLSSIVHPNQEGHSLDAVAERFNITIVGRHTALGDALVTAEIFLKLIPLLEAQGIHTLEDALQASGKSPFAKIKY